MASNWLLLFFNNTKSIYFQAHNAGCFPLYILISSNDFSCLLPFYVPRPPPSGIVCPVLPLAIIPGTHSISVLEGVLEVVAADKAASEGDLRDRIVGGEQLIGGMLQADEHQILVNPDPDSLAEPAAEVIRAVSRKGPTVSVLFS